MTPLAGAASTRPHDADNLKDVDAEVYRHLQPWIELNYGVSHVEEEPLNLHEITADPTFRPKPSSDHTLTSFAALAASRLQCARCIISLTDSQRMWLLAEATSSTIPGVVDSHYDSADDLWLGRCLLKRHTTICGNVLNILAGKTLDNNKNDIHIIPDLSLRSENEKCIPIVTNPNIKFYAGVPLVSAGHMIGVCAVLDDKPRNAFSDTDAAILRGIANTATMHLATLRRVTQQRRGELLVKGLSLFTEGQSSLRNWWRISSRQNRSFGAEAVLSTSDDADTTASKAFGPAHHFDKSKHQMAQKSAASSSRSSSGSESGRGSNDSGSQINVELNARYSEAQHKSSATGNELSVFSRASNIIREACGLDGGVLFFDASGELTRSIPRKGDDNATLDKEQREQITRTTHAHDEPLCVLLGYSVSSKSSLYRNAPSSNHKAMTQRDLAFLIRNHSSGSIFNFFAGGEMIDDANNTTLAESTDASTSAESPQNSYRFLRSICPNARSIAFLPIWDHQNSRWRAGALAWTRSPIRTLQANEDLTYLYAFSCSITNELNRLASERSELARTLFFSTVSHELRSPLHGILAGVEFLRDTIVEPQAESLLSAIESNGRNLMDTIENMLEYADTSRTDKVQESGKVPLAVSDEQADLGEILEKTLASSVLSSYGTLNITSSDTDQTSNLLTDTAKALDIVLDVDWSTRWIVNIKPASLKRIAANLIGNALKFTEKGSVTVCLSVDISGCVVVAVKDTGKGMSQDYITNNLFVAFSKESEFSAGTGIGLQVCRQIASDFGGRLDLTSDTSDDNHGTRATLTIPAKCANLQIRGKPLRGRRHLLIGLCDGIWEGAIDQNEYWKSTASALKKAIGVTLTRVTDILQTPVDVLVVPEEMFRSTVAPAIETERERPLVTPIIVLCGSVAFARQAVKSFRFINFVLPPYGPQALSHAIESCYPGILKAESTRGIRKALTTRQTLAESLDFSPLSSGDSDVPPSDTVISPTESNSTLSIDEVEPTGRILLVEDNEINMRLLVAFAKKNKLQYETAVDGQKALDIYTAVRNQKPFDVILTDVNMPNLDGIEMTRRIRAIEREKQSQTIESESSSPPKPTVQIIALTGVSTDLARHEAELAGVDMFLSKPAPFKMIWNLIITRLKKDEKVPIHTRKES